MKNTRNIQLAVGLALALVLSLGSLQAARADTYVVTNSNNSGDGSLRQAITDANNNSVADTITFDAATNGIPIVLVGPASENANVSGDLDILDGGDLTIQGNGAANTIIDGGGIDRVFHVCPAGGCANTVTFSGVTIQNGEVLASGGGGIRNEAGTTTLDASTVISNAAVNGGGIANFATLNIQNGSTIGGAGAGNTTMWGNGGGIYNYAGTLTVNHSTVSANTASNYGGGIWSQATLNVQNGSTIGGVGAGNRADYGGGIYNYGGGATTVHSSDVISNMADYGGGIYNDDGTTTVDGSTVISNTADRRGGGIYNRATLSVQNNSAIGRAGAGNIAGYGGGIYNYNGGATTVTGSTVSANMADYGGGICNEDGTTTVDASTVNANTASYGGGGIYNSAGSTTTVTGSRILNNTDSTNGGGVLNDRDVAGATNVTGSCIVGNSAMSFFNNQTAQQIATGNWWGAATGPNTPGDTVGGNVDVSGHLTEPILGCGFNVYDVYLPLALK